jgi:hypothetical protein
MMLFRVACYSGSFKLEEFEDRRGIVFPTENAAIAGLWTSLLHGLGLLKR